MFRGQPRVERVLMAKRITGIVFGIIYLVAGIFMIRNPKAALITISVSLGWILLVAGVVLIIYSLTQHFDAIDHSSFLIEGTLASLLGLMFLFGNKVNNATALSYLLIFWVIIDSAIQLQYARYLPKEGIKYAVIIMDVLIIGYCIYMLFHPSSAGSFLVFVTGIGFISTGINKLIRNL